MANEEHRAALSQGAAVWNQWRDDNLVIPDLSGANLSGANLSEANLSEANLIGANLNRANLSEAKLIGARLIGAYLSGANLIGATLNRANLSEAYLNRADLSGANLSDTNLSETNLSEANLSEANLSEANLIGANLSGAYLNLAYLNRANFSGANLSLTNLSGANLSGANLSGANFKQVILFNTSFSDVDLSEVQGLETVRHHGPSSIGVDTIYNSQGNIPEIFLRGCGLPENFITYARSLTGTAIEWFSCFISYNHTDQSFARRLHDALQGQGVRCWLDEKQLLPGDDIHEAIDRGIRVWDKVLLCCTKDSLTSWWVEEEIDKAFEKERRLMTARGKKVLALIPLDLDGHIFKEPGWENGRKSQVLSRVAADFTNWETNNAKFEEQFNRVLQSLRADDGRYEPPPEPKL